MSAATSGIIPAYRCAHAGYLLLEGDRLMAIREHADATEEERKVTLCNAGVMAFDGHRALEILDRIGKANSKGEYYLVSGSVITKDVPDDAMAVERSPQNNREGGAKRYREMKMRAKKPKEG
jgi:bifunctional N-acetylglucosamine-1-phosphate-uridyltransferase/glucosamine-1-phosphate-acetyltransferase GlmU-like protein